MDAIKQGRLVITPDGYFGIVTSVTDRTVFTGNGVDVVIPADDWQRCQQLPMKVGETGTYADFFGIERYLVDRSP